MDAARLPKRLRLALSTSYDGVVVATTRFVELYKEASLTGLQLTPLGGSAFVVSATALVRFDAAVRGTRFENRCAECEQYESVIGAAPAYLMKGEEVPVLGFARTDLEFGSDDEKLPVLVCGDGAAEVVRSARFKGLDLEKVQQA